MSNRNLFVAGGLLAFLPMQSFSQEVDMALMMKWADTSVVAYNITGVYEAESPIAFNERSGQVADVTDRVVLDITWNMAQYSIVGEAKIQNFPSQATNLRNLVASCPAPVMKGTYEHFEATRVTPSGPDRIELVGTTSFSAVDLTDCEGAAEKRTVAASQDSSVVYLPMLNPMVLAMPAMGSDGQIKVTVSPDKKSFAIKLGGWTWTYLPTRVS